jgi:hypothetical protein
VYDIHHVVEQRVIIEGFNYGAMSTRRGGAKSSQFLSRSFIDNIAR